MFMRGCRVAHLSWLSTGVVAKVDGRHAGCMRHSHGGARGPCIRSVGHLWALPCNNIRALSLHHHLCKQTCTRHTSFAAGMCCKGVLLLQSALYLHPANCVQASQDSTNPQNDAMPWPLQEPLPRILPASQAMGTAGQLASGWLPNSSAKAWASWHLQSVCHAPALSVEVPWVALSGGPDGLAATLSDSALRYWVCGAGLQRTCAAAGRQDVHARRKHVHAAPCVAPGVQPCEQP